MKIDLTKKELGAVSELIYALIEDHAQLRYAPGNWHSGGEDASLTNKGTRLLTSAWSKISEAGAASAMWDEVFDPIEPCEKCQR